MMRHSMMAVVAVLFVLGAIRAENVRPSSAEKYHFSRPNLPSNIVGTVIGDPPAYNIPRSEDVAWLREAYAERVALAGGAPFGNSWTGVLAEAVEEVPQFGLWPLSETNRFSRWSAAAFGASGSIETNIFVGYNFVTNRGTGVDTADIRHVNLYSGLAADLLANTNGNASGCLSLSNSLYISSPQAFDVDGDLAVTNIERVTIWHDAWTNATSLLSMQMTNGTVSVYTNEWRVYAPTSTIETVTNVTTVQKTGIYSIFKDGIVHGYSRALPPPLDGILSSAAFTNHYAFLRGANRFGKATAATNDVFQRYSGAYESPGGRYIVTTNGILSSPYLFRNCDISAYRSWEPQWGPDQSESEKPESWNPDTGESGQQYFVRTGSASQRFRIVMSGFAAAPDGSLSISSARAFADVTLSYNEDSSAGIRGESGTVYETNLLRRVMVPLGSVHPRLERLDIVFDLTLGLSVFETAWQAASFPHELPTSDSFIPNLRFSCPTGEHGEWADEVYAGLSSTSLEFGASLNGVFVVIDFRPITSLPSWE